jgi:thymidylate synthase (FAD)
MKIVPMEVQLIHHVGSDLTVANAARVSFNKISDELTEKDSKLINYLATHDHHSPFNHSFLTFRVKAPIFVARQLVKHKFMPWNEVSRRYVDDEPEFYFPEHWRARAENVKQGSSNMTTELPTYNYKETIKTSLGNYLEALDLGCCPEQARMILPQNTMTEWYWSGTLGAFMDMLKLRLDPHTQQETREVATMIAAQVKELFPVSYEAYIDE